MTGRGTGRPRGRPVRSLSRWSPPGRCGLLLVLAVLQGCSGPAEGHAVAQGDGQTTLQRHESAGEIAPSASPATLGSDDDSSDSSVARAERHAHAAIDTTGFRIVVSLADRALWVVDGADTLRRASAGVGMDSTLSYEGKVWKFETPRGVRRVIAKKADPKWSPPEWHYVEMAQARHLRLVRLPAGRPLRLADSSEIVVRDGDVGLVRPGELFRPFAAGEEIIWDSTLFIPPLGTKQRQVAGELGRYRLDLGDGYLLHGTPYTESIGQPSSHGCIRLADDDVEWLYEHVPVGTPVVIH
jgi:hypothetical protein